MVSKSTVSALLLAAGVLVTAPACAQTYRYGYPDYRADVQRRAYDRGFHEGSENGREDARRNRPADYRRHSEFRDADEGYSRSYGDKEYYREMFRRGYTTGYDEAYRANAGYGRYPAPPPAAVYPAPPSASTYPAYPPAATYRSPAANVGYRDGVKAGRDDAHDGKRYDPVRSHDYRDADHDYDRRYGDRDAYKRDYRVAFEQGYRDGFAQGRR